MTERALPQGKPEQATVDVTLRMSPELAEKLRTWSEPVQARLVETPGVGTGWELELSRTGWPA